jgi:AmmeMemoRadiSam system protein A
MAEVGTLMTQELNEVEQKILLIIAREALEKSTQAEALPEIILVNLPPTLQANGASFVTLTKNDNLRGCIGTLEAYQPLALDVQEHAVAAALQDPRFPKVSPEEVDQINIEISVLTPKTALQYDAPEELSQKIRPNIDGVVLQDGFRKATFLPQVWDQLNDPEAFLSHLCAKMGASPNFWRKKVLQVFTYQVQEFQES